MLLLVLLPVEINFISLHHDPVGFKLVGLCLHVNDTLVLGK